MEAEWEQTPDFHKAWLDKSRDVIARAEWRRRKLTKRVRAGCPSPASHCMTCITLHG